VARLEHESGPATANIVNLLEMLPLISSLRHIAVGDLGTPGFSEESPLLPEWNSDHVERVPTNLLRKGPAL
jgi:hypothetical protein